MAIQQINPNNYRYSSSIHHFKLSIWKKENSILKREEEKINDR